MENVTSDSAFDEVKEIVVECRDSCFNCLNLLESYMQSRSVKLVTKEQTPASDYDNSGYV